MLPQSPKYLVQIGKPEEALRLLRRIYSVNKRKPADTFPVRRSFVTSLRSLRLLPFPDKTASRVGARVPIPPLLLRGEFRKDTTRLLQRQTITLVAALVRRSVSRLSPIRQHAGVSFLLATARSNPLPFATRCLFRSPRFNTMRLWVPYLFTILNNFDYETWTKDRSPTICEMLDRRMSVPAREYLNCPEFENICTGVRTRVCRDHGGRQTIAYSEPLILQWTISGKVYENSAIIAFSAVFFSFLVGTISTSTLRKRTILRKYCSLELSSGSRETAFLGLTLAPRCSRSFRFVGGKLFRNKLGAASSLHVDPGIHHYRGDKDNG